MKYCLIGEYPRDDAPGGGLLAYHLACWLGEPTLFIARTGPHSRGPCREAPAHVRVVDFRLRDFYLSARLRPSAWDYLGYAAKAVVVAGFLLRAAPYIARFRPDVVHVHSATGFPLGCFARRFLGAKLLVTFHGTELKRLAHSRLLHGLYRRHVHVATYVAQDMRPLVEQVLPGVMAVHTPIGVDVAQFSLAEPKTNEMLAVGRLRWQKGYGDLLRAMQTVFAQRPDVRLVIVGEGEMRSEIEEAIRQPPLQGRVDLVAGMDRAALARQMARARLFLMPSVSEGMPKVLVEALAAGTPVVATRVGDAEAVVGDCGRLVAPGDPEAFARAILELLADPDGLGRLSAAARERGKLFDWDQVLRPFRSIMHHLLQEDPSGGRR